MRRVRPKRTAACSVCSSLCSGKSLVVRQSQHLASPLPATLAASRHQGVLSLQQRCALRLRVVPGAASPVQCSALSSASHSPGLLTLHLQSSLLQQLHVQQVMHPPSCLQGGRQRRGCVPHSGSCPGTSVGQQAPALVHTRCRGSQQVAAVLGPRTGTSPPRLPPST